MMQSINTTPHLSMSYDSKQVQVQGVEAVICAWNATFRDFPTNVAPAPTAPVATASRPSALAKWLEMTSQKNHVADSSPSVQLPYMAISLPLKEMSTEEKLEVIDTVWTDLLAHSEKIPVPDWHLDELKKAETQAKNGDNPLLSLEEAKTQLREQFK